MEKITGSNLLAHSNAIFRYNNGKLFFCGKKLETTARIVLEDITAMPVKLLPAFAMAVNQNFHVQRIGSQVRAIAGD